MCQGGRCLDFFFFLSQEPRHCSWPASVATWRLCVFCSRRGPVQGPVIEKDRLLPHDYALYVSLLEGLDPPPDCCVKKNGGLWLLCGASRSWWRVFFNVLADGSILCCSVGTLGHFGATDIQQRRCSPKSQGWGFTSVHCSPAWTRSDVSHFVEPWGLSQGGIFLWFVATACGSSPRLS